MHRWHAEPKLTISRTSRPGRRTPYVSAATRPAEAGTLQLVSLGALVLLACRWEWSPSPAWLLTTSLGWIALSWGLWRWLNWGAGKIQLTTSGLVILFSIWVGVPTVMEWLARRLGFGDAPEFILLSGIQNAALLSAALSHRRRCQANAALLSSFVLFFVVVISQHRLVHVGAALFGVMMLWWLMIRYWERIQSSVLTGRSVRALPIRTAVAGAVALVVVALLAAIGTTPARTYFLSGFVPTSGGDQWNDPFARSGVGDGDALVAATREAMSFGPVESDLFLDSDMPTLYDMFNDLYGDPPSATRQTQRSVGLAPGEVQEPEQRIATSQKSGREFSTLRSQVDGKSGSLDDRESKAVLHILGKVPLHLALERFDTFDGVQWTTSGESPERSPIRLQPQGGRPWMWLRRAEAYAWTRGVERHALKIVNLETNRFPSPPHLLAVSIDKVDQLAFFGWTEDDVLAMPVRERIPQLTVVQLISEKANLQPLRDPSRWTQLSGPHASAQRSASSPALADAPGRQTLNRLAREWTRDIPRGWCEVEAIVERLRTEFTLDANATLPEATSDAVGAFLARRRGPDYLFATTAALLLRELGYSTRLVTGFYASEAKYDRRAGQTSVMPDDVHAWVEVRVVEGAWVPIEPTPGYQRPRESLSWMQRMAQAGSALWKWGVRKVILLAGLTTGLVLLIATRVFWLDRLAVYGCQLAGIGGPHRRVLWTIRLLEYRAWLAGRARPATETLSAWYGGLLTHGSPLDSRHLRHTLSVAERLLYSPPGIGELQLARSDVQQACRTVVRRVNVQLLRQRPPGPRRAHHANP